eukprot:11092377-Ditylum_brightwellii.AAC.1
MDKDAYPCYLPQTMKLLEQIKPDALVEAMIGKPGGDSGVAFAQTKGYAPTCFNCCARGHTANECLKFDATERDKFWADRKATHAAVGAESHTPAPAPAPAANIPAPGPAANTTADFE